MMALLPMLSVLRNPWVLLLIACSLGIAGTSFYNPAGPVAVGAEAVIEYLLCLALVIYVAWRLRRVLRRVR